MSRFRRYFLAGLILGLVGWLAVPVASACTVECVFVSQEPFCMRCRDVGEYTGATCRNSGTCGCFYTQNTCGLAANGIQAETSLADLGLLPESLQCSDRTATNDAETDLLLVN